MKKAHFNGQRIFILFLILILPTFFIKEIPVLKSKKEASISRFNTYYEGNPYEERLPKITVLVPIEEAKPHLHWNLRSLEQQNYPTFEIVYIDASKEREAAKILQEMHEKAAFEKKIEIVRANSQEELNRIYFERVLSAGDDDLIVHLPATGWLSHENALMRIQKAFTNQDVWLAHTQYLEFPSLKKGLRPPSRISLQNKKAHRLPWAKSPIKIYYAGLFRRFEKAKHLKSGFFETVANINQLLNPLAEEGRAHLKFIHEALFIYEEKESFPLGELQLGDLGEKATKAFLPKELLTHVEKNRVQGVIFSEKSPKSLEKLLPSLKKIHNIANWIVLYEHKPSQLVHYRGLEARYPKIRFINVLEEQTFQRKESISAYLRKYLHSDYILLLDDQMQCISSIELDTCIQMMEENHGRAFFLSLGQFREGNIFLEDLQGAGISYLGRGVYSWNLRRGRGLFKGPKLSRATLIKEEELLKNIASSQQTSLRSFIEMIEKKPFQEGVGLFFIEPKFLKQQGKN